MTPFVRRHIDQLMVWQRTFSFKLSFLMLINNVESGDMRRKNVIKVPKISTRRIDNKRRNQKVGYLERESCVLKWVRVGDSNYGYIVIFEEAFGMWRYAIDWGEGGLVVMKIRVPPYELYLMFFEIKKLKETGNSSSPKKHSMPLSIFLSYLVSIFTNFWNWWSSSHSISTFKIINKDSDDVKIKNDDFFTKTRAKWIHCIYGKSLKDVNDLGVTRLHIHSSLWKEFLTKPTTHHCLI